VSLGGAHITISGRDLQYHGDIGCTMKRVEGCIGEQAWTWEGCHYTVLPAGLDVTAFA
jgi:hypothetical protein